MIWRYVNQNATISILTKLMKTTKTIFSLIAVVAITLILNSCSNQKTSQDEVSQPEITEEKKTCCMNDPNVLVIVASITVKNEADKADVEKALHAVVDGTRTEEGNIAYVLHQDINNPLTYVIIEAWKSQEAIDFHNQTPHYKALGEALGDKATVSVNTMKKTY